MADGERSPLLSDLGDGGGMGASVGPGAPSPGTALPSAAPYGGPGSAPSNKPQGKTPPLVICLLARLIRSSHFTISPRMNLCARF